MLELEITMYDVVIFSERLRPRSPEKSDESDNGELHRNYQKLIINLI